jgi:hypothetical protein
MSEQELRNGQVFILKDKYETVEVSVGDSKTLQAHNAFKIHLNNKPVIINKDYILLQNKLRDLILI